jgi:hypothetical protein
MIRYNEALFASISQAVGRITQVILDSKLGETWDFDNKTYFND